MQGYLVYVFPEGGRGHYGTVVIATHAKFDLTFFPARKNNKRVKDLFLTLPARTEERQIMRDLCDQDDILEVDTQNEDEATCTAELIADGVSPTGKELVADDAKLPTAQVLPAAVPFSSTASTDIDELPKMEATHKGTNFQRFGIPGCYRLGNRPGMCRQAGRNHRYARLLYRSKPSRHQQ